MNKHEVTYTARKPPLSLKNSLRIAMVAACPCPYPRGTPIRIVRMAEALARRGHQVHVITYHLGRGVVSNQVQVHRIPHVGTYQKYSPGPTYQKLLVLDPLLMVKLLSMLRKYDFDIIHAHHYEGVLVSALARLRRPIPLVYDAHTLLSSELPFFNLGLSFGTKRFIARRLDCWFPKLADHVICVTDTIRQKLITDGHMDPARISVISNGVEHELFRPPEKSAKAATQGGNPTLIFTGNLASYQGVDLLLRALREIVASRRSVRLRMVTQASFDQYEKLAQELGIRGHIDLLSVDFEHLPSLLAAADIAVNPRTDCDGIPQKLLNYMAASKPIVSFEGSAPCIEHGKTGWVVENENVTAFAQGVLTLLDDPAMARELGLNARTYVLSHHTWELTAEESERVYTRLLRTASDTIDHE